MGACKGSMPSASVKRECSYAGCKSPQESRKFFNIDGRSSAGGQDWSGLAGSVLCATCYDQFLKRGTLERTRYQHKPLAKTARRCSYEGCRDPDDSKIFYQIDGGNKAGGQDWTDLAGSVLCKRCYGQFCKRGRLERIKNEPLAGSARRCTYMGCKNPTESRQFVQIDGASTAGGRDWSPLAGSVLCNSCRLQYRAKGTLERTQHQHKPLADIARRCTYAGCPKPLESGQFIQIDGKSEAGGQNWTELSGSVLCRLCYDRFLRRGTLSRSTSNESAADFDSLSPGRVSSSARKESGTVAGNKRKTPHRSGGGEGIDSVGSSYERSAAANAARGNRGATAGPGDKRIRAGADAGMGKAGVRSGASAVGATDDGVNRQEIDGRGRSRGVGKIGRVRDGKKVLGRGRGMARLNRGEGCEEEEGEEEEEKEEEKEREKQAYEGLHVLSSVLEKLTGDW